MEVAFEIRVFFLCGLCGVACGIVYDLFRIARRCLHAGVTATFILDILFWMVCAFLTFGMVFYANYGRMRWYEVVGILLGGTVYFASVSRLVVDGGVCAVDALCRLLKGVLKLVFFPVFFLLRLLLKPVLKLSGIHT